MNNYRLDASVRPFLTRFLGSRAVSEFAYLCGRRLPSLHADLDAPLGLVRAVAEAGRTRCPTRRCGSNGGKRSSSAVVVASPNTLSPRERQVGGDLMLVCS